MEVTGLTRRFLVRERPDVSGVKQAASHAAARARLDPDGAARVALVAAEMATNLVKHTSGGGEVLVNTWIPPAGEGGVELIAIDRGPGMANPAHAFEDGFSTAGSRGTGLGAIRRQSSYFDIHSLPGLGTAVLARFLPAEAAAPPRAFAVGVVTLPIDGEDVSGDGWVMGETPSGLQVMVVDGLGHGLLASEAAAAALQCFRRSGPRPGTELLQSVHEALRGTRGATGAAATIDVAARQLRFAGIGNIAGRVIQDVDSRQLVSMNGTLGRDPVRCREFPQPWRPGSLLVMHSDGLSSHWQLENVRGLINRDPALIAAVLFRDHARNLDDLTVVVVREAGLTPEVGT